MEVWCYLLIFQASYIKPLEWDLPKTSFKSVIDCNWFTTPSELCFFLNFFLFYKIRKQEFQSNRVVYKKLSTELRHRKRAHTQIFLHIPCSVLWANMGSFITLFLPQLSNQKVDEGSDQHVFFLWFLFSEAFLYEISCISTSFCLVQLKLFALLSHRLSYLL